MNTDIVNEVEQLENIISVCFGKPEGDELPQVATPDEIIVDLVSRSTGQTYCDAEAQLK